MPNTPPKNRENIVPRLCQTDKLSWIPYTLILFKVTIILDTFSKMLIDNALQNWPKTPKPPLQTDFGFLTLIS